ncbi:Gfo/Idh/MocA family protein [Urechidicola vernalis]|uniref:Gfo/Idh/MocA family oxidoreductase n=1 Tax=Urechidicola vernalis TaxID=3075600 RepID=A0ABU2Y7G2_9FLAO|nr:Gfo/Idh/MocA family oxidoreductase [Urechidicola sp. P050]MDT0554153.1 Gfo/Idh/MocA family oxidoreductase [Urechidicola sp. P050]
MMRALIIGLGSIAQKHIEAIRKLDSNSELYALNSSSQKLEKLGVTNLTSLENIARLNLDFVIVSNPTYKHFDTIQKLKKFKIPLFIEKPLFSNLNAKEELVHFIISENIVTYVACNLRFLECLIYTKKLITNKRINEVNIYCGSYLPEWRKNVDFKKVYSANKEQGGGVHLDLIHEIDYAYWLFGNPIKINRIFSCKSSLNIDSYDYANYNLQYDRFNINIVLNYFRKDSKRTLEIVCDDETLLIDLLNNKVYKGDKIIFESRNKIYNTYESQMKFFQEEILSGKSKMNSIEEAYKILKICLKKD